MLYYREAKDGQLLEEGITEAGALSSWVAAATSYSVHGLPMLPFYIYYSMFGFQRVGDLIWAAADQRARGFLLGATAGRTTLGGEGLQHQDGSSHVMAATVPNCRAYDPAFAGELAVILDHGARQMLERSEDEFYYVTVMNENYAQPSACRPASRRAIIRGLYRYARHVEAKVPRRGAPARLRHDPARGHRRRRAAGRRTGRRAARSGASPASASWRARRVRSSAGTGCIPAAPPRSSHLGTCLAGEAPVIAATDYVRAWPQLIASYVDAPFIVLGTDGFGRSDTRAALRRFFEVDRHQIVLARSTVWCATACCRAACWRRPAPTSPDHNKPAPSTRHSSLLTLLLPSKAHASPSVRQFARVLGVDVAKVAGSGIKGRITQQDVEGYVKFTLAQATNQVPQSANGGLSVLAWAENRFQ
jgi:pyruvate dehydrogenase E1 component